MPNAVCIRFCLLLRKKWPAGWGKPRVSQPQDGAVSTNAFSSTAGARVRLHVYIDELKTCHKLALFSNRNRHYVLEVKQVWWVPGWRLGIVPGVTLRFIDRDSHYVPAANMYTMNITICILYLMFSRRGNLFAGLSSSGV